MKDTELCVGIGILSHELENPNSISLISPHLPPLPLLLCEECNTTAFFIVIIFSACRGFGVDIIQVK